MTNWERSRAATHNTTSLLPSPPHPPSAPSSQLRLASPPQFKEVVITHSSRSPQSRSKTSSTFGLSSSSSAIVHPITTATTSTTGSTCALSSLSSSSSSSSSPPSLSNSKALTRTFSTSSNLNLQSGHLTQELSHPSHTDSPTTTATPTTQSSSPILSHRQLHHTAHQPGQPQPEYHDEAERQEQQPPGQYPMNRSERGSQVQETIAAFSRLMMEGKSATATTTTTTTTNNSFHNSNSCHFYKSAPVLPLLTISTPPVSSTLESSQLSASPSPPALSPVSGTASSSSNSSESSSPATPSTSTMPTTAITTMNDDKTMFSLSQPVMPMSLIPAAIMGLQSTPPCVTAVGMMIGDNNNNNNNNNHAQGIIKINTDLSSILINNNRRGSKGSTTSSGSRSSASLLPLVGRDYLSFTDTNTSSSTTSSPLSAKPRPLSSMEFAESWLPTVANLSPEGSIVNAESSRMVPLSKEMTVATSGYSGTKERDSSVSNSQHLFAPVDENRTHGHIIGGMQESDQAISFPTSSTAKSCTGTTITSPSFSATTTAVAVARVSMDQHSIHPLQMDPDPDSISTSITMTGTIDPAVTSPLDFGSSFVLESLQPQLGQQQEEEQQEQPPMQVIRKKTSFAAKLRKVFVAKQPTSSNNNSSVNTTTYSPRESSLGMLADAQQTQENITMLVSPVSPEDDASSDEMNSDRLRQHRGSDSSVSTVETPVTRPTLLRRGSAPTLSNQYLAPPALLTTRVLYSDPESEASSSSPITPQSSTEGPSEQARLPSNQTTVIQGLKSTPTRTVKKRLSFASISSFFNGRQASNSSLQQQQQEQQQQQQQGQNENHSKQQRSSSVPHVENPLAIVGRQIAGFQRRHSLNDLDDKNAKRSQNTNALQRFMSTTPWDKERAPSGSASDGSTPVSAPVTLGPKRLSLNKVFSKQLRRKSSTPVKTDILPVPPKPLRSALAHRSAVTVTVNSNLVGAAGAKVHHVHRSSRRRAASIRSQSSTQRHSHPPTGVSAGGRNRLSQTDPLARLSEANKQLATLSRSNVEDQQQQQAHLKRLASKKSKGNHRREQEQVRGGKRQPNRHLREQSQHGRQDSITSTVSEDSESCSSPVSLEGPAGFPVGGAESQHVAPSPTRLVPPGQGVRTGGAFDSHTHSSPTTPRVLPVVTKFGSPPINPLATLSPSPSYESYSSVSDRAAASFRSTSSLSESGSCSSSSLSSPNGSPTTEKVPQLPAADVGAVGCNSGQNTLLPAAAARLSVSAITVERGAGVAATSTSDAILTPKPQQTTPSLGTATTTSTLESSSSMSNSSTSASSTSSPISKSEMVHTRDESLRGVYSIQQQQASQSVYQQYIPDQLAGQAYPGTKDVQNYHHHQYLQTLQLQQQYHQQLQQQQVGTFHYPHHQQYYYADPSLYPPRPPRQLQFSTAEPMIHPTWTPEQYDRTSDPNITASRLTPAVAHRIKLELNQFKSQEMDVHEDSRIYTHFFI